ncbi:C35C5.3 [Symbiodinium necroappetens]|uniref:C35C5.3 protein n=1 Tax=Symbiodinium necroappetens TaxID=1628268 RepID=A0A812X1D9_9DINO|nr:C35C5.3 [Symbiodinium necroappetens]
MTCNDEPTDSTTFQNFEALHQEQDKLAVLVLGGSKFMGKAFVEMILHHARVCVVNRGKTYWAAPDPFAGKAARVLSDRDKGDSFAAHLREATRRLGTEWDCVVDFSGFCGGDVHASLQGLDGAFKLYIYISSDSVYEVSTWAYEKWKPRKRLDGRSGYETHVSEGLAVRPATKEQQEIVNNNDGYGNEKLQGEEVLLKELPAGCKCFILRLPDVIGPCDSTHRLWAYWHWLRAGELGAPPPQVQSYKRKRKSWDANGDEIAQAPGDAKLALVYSLDVAKFLLRLVTDQPTKAVDIVNLCCEEQLQLSEFLEQLFAASGGNRKRPRLAPDRNPKVYLPSVDRLWPLSCERAREVYGFRPTPLEEVLTRCVEFFETGCAKFPDEARKAAVKLPSEPAATAIKILGYASNL